MRIPCGPYASTQKAGVTYKGAIRDDRGKAIWVCEHFHDNRDNDTYGYVVRREMEGMSALTCANRHLKTMEDAR